MNLFIIGNGKSRLTKDIERLNSMGITFGCNALYRDHKVDYLVSVDPDMSKEIMTAGIIEGTTVLVRPQSWLSESSTLKFIPPELDKGWLAGTTAILLAVDMFPHVSNFYLVGFDMLVSNPNKDDKINNVYAGTNNYLATSSPPIPSDNSIKQVNDICYLYPDKKFYHIGGDVSCVDKPNFFVMSNFGDL